MPTVRILIAHDSPMFRSGLKTALLDHQDLEILYEIDDFSLLPATLADGNIDFVLLGGSFYQQAALSLLQEMKNQNTGICLMLLLPPEPGTLLYEFLDLGCEAVIPYDAPLLTLRKTFSALQQGKPSIPDDFAKAWLHRIAKSKILPPLLSDREVDVLRQIALGYSSKEVAEILHLSPRTVENHRFRILKKLKLKNSVQLALWAVKEEIIEAKEAV